MSLRTSGILIPFIMLFLLLSGCSKDDGPSNHHASNKLPLGDSAADILAADKYTSLKVDLVYVEGYTPSETALYNLKLFLQERINKPGGITISKRSVEPTGGSSLTTSQIVDLEEQYRNEYTAGNTIAIFILFYDGTSMNEENEEIVLGTAYRNTSMIIYGKSVNQLSMHSGVPKSDIETTVLKHEFGHLFGLVNNGSPSQSPHEDPESKAHCSSEGCLMNSSVEFGKGALKMIKSSHRAEFDSGCLADLRANGGK